MDFKSSILKKIIAWIIGVDAYSLIEKTAKTLLTENDMTSEEKHQKVYTLAKTEAKKVAKVFLDIAIKFVVAYIKGKLNEK